MASSCVLVVTNSADLHADLVVAHLRRGRESVFRLDLDRYPAEYATNLQFRDGHWSGGLRCLSDGQDLQIAQIGAVWMRKSAEFSFRSSDLAAQERAYAVEEMNHLLFSLLYSLDCYWMSHPMCLRGASWKGEQLVRAARMGFATPRSLMTDQPAEVRRLGEQAPAGIVFKSLSSPDLAAHRVDPADRVADGAPTTLVAHEDDALLAGVQELPCFFQNYVPKAYELRVTVVGDQVFAAKIHSQDDPRTAVDVRDFSAEIRYEAAHLPPVVERRCLDLVHSYGLQYGAIDLIVTPEGEYVFLENNPVGQFLFIEQLVPELQLTRAVAETLAAGARQTRAAGAWALRPAARAQGARVGQ